MNNSLKNKVDAALSSINHIKAATPSPFFYTRLLAKINNGKGTVWEKWSAFFLRPTVAFAALCFIIVVNAYVLYSKLGDDISSPDQTELASSDIYNDTVTALYDLENLKP
ncbi:MAG: hypothetical protein ABIO55_15455 [Ginsengibacter sp.]